MAMLRTYDYIITLKPARSYAAYDWISQLMLFSALVSFVYIVINTDSLTVRTAGYIFTGLVIGTWIMARKWTESYRIALGIAGIGWVALIQAWPLTILYSLCSLLEKQVKFRRELGFDNDGITINTFPKKKYQWHEVNNVILKDGILTVDLYNNKIIQRELADEPTDHLEKEFNEFCRSNMLAV